MGVTILLLQNVMSGQLECPYLSSRQHTNLQELANHSPLGLNLTDDTALVCPASVNFNV